MKLIGRKEYLKEFNNYVEKIKTNERTVFNIYGLRGMGKSALLQEFKRSSKAIEVDVIELDFKKIQIIGDFYKQLDIELATKEIETRYFDLAYLIYFQKKNPKITIQDKLPEWVEEFGDISELIGLGGAVIGPAKSIFKGFNKLKNKFQLKEEILKSINKLHEKNILEIEDELIQFLRYDIELLSQKDNYDGIIFLMDSYENIDRLLDEELYAFIEKLDNSKSFFVIATENYLEWEKNFIHIKELIPLSDSESKEILMDNGLNETELVSKLVETCEGIGLYLTLAIKIFNKKDKENNEEILLKINNILLEEKKNLNRKILNSSIDTNRPSYINKQYSNDIFRRETYNNLNSLLKSKEEPNILCMLYGSAGIGKSSFMATSFSKLSNEEFNKVIYFLEDGSDDLKEIDSLYKLIENTILMEFEEKKIYFDNNIIYGDSDILDKLEYLLDTYSQKIYLSYDKPFILMIDGLDTLVDKEKFVSKLVKNHKGIHFVFSTRKKFNNDFYTVLKNKNKNLYIYNNKNGISLENLNKESTNLYFDKTQELDSFLDEEKISYIKKSIYLKSKGLPKYFELLIKKLNKLIINDKDSIYEKAQEYIQKSPEELEDFYIEEFNNTKTNSKLSLEILVVLYWYNKTIEKSILKYFIAEENSETIDIALSEISHFLNMNENKYQINHLSIKEALFVYFQKDEFKKLTAVHLSESFIKSTLKNEAPFLKYLTDVDVKKYELFSSIYYFNDENLLFKSLKSMVETAIENKSFQKPIDILSLYFDYSRILFIQDMIGDKILLENKLKVTDLFEKEELSIETKKFILNILAIYSNTYTDNIHNLKLLLSLSILGQNNYFINKYLKKYKIFKESEKYNNIFSDAILNKEKYKNLNLISSKIYVSMHVKLMKQQLDSALFLYEDDGLLLLVDNTVSRDINENIINLLLKNQRIKKQRGYIETQKRLYQTLKHSSNINLKKYFYYKIYNYKKHNENMSSDIRDFLNEVSIDILLQDIKNLSLSNNMYKYLSNNEKNKLNKLNQFYRAYQEQSLSFLLKTKNLDYFYDIIYFIEIKDIIEFITFYIEHSDEKTFNIIATIVRRETTDEILLFCKKYLIGRGVTSYELLIIYYKLGKIDKLRKTIIQIEEEKNERLFINKLLYFDINPIMDIYPLLEKANKGTSSLLINYLKKNTFTDNELDCFGKIILENNREKFSLLLSDISFLIEDSKKLKKIFLQYKDFLSEEDLQIIILNIMIHDSFDKFEKNFITFDNRYQIYYLTRIIESYKGKNTNPPYKFLYLLFNTISTSNFDKNVYSLVRKFYTEKYYINFSKENHLLIEKIYLSINENLTNYALEIKVRLYKLFLNYYTEEKYFDLLNEEWIPNKLKSRMAMGFIFKMKNKEEMQRLSTLCLTFDRAKALIHIGIIFNSDDELKEGIDILYKFKKERKENTRFFENYLEFTIPNNKSLILKTSNFINNIYIPKHKHKTLLSMYLNIEEFISSNHFLEHYIQFPKEFLKNYFSYIQFENKIEDNYFNDVSNVTLVNLAILYDQYKEAEENEDEENYNKFENTFSLLKIKYPDILTIYFNELETLSLDNMFSRVNYEDSNLKELIKTDYNKFYKQIQNLYNDYIGKDIKKIDMAQKKFEQLKENLKDSDESMKLLKEKSWIKSKLSLKLENVELFRPK